eukprot:164004-Rhodomonas_salina.1
MVSVPDSAYRADEEGTVLGIGTGRRRVERGGVSEGVLREGGRVQGDEGGGRERLVAPYANSVPDSA